MNHSQVYDGYKPVVCELIVKQNRMSLTRNGGFLGIVKVHNFNDDAVRMFDPTDIVIHLHEYGIYLSMNDLVIIQECWNEMQEQRKELTNLQ